MAEVQVFQKLQRTVEFHRRTKKNPAVLGGWFFSPKN